MPIHRRVILSQLLAGASALALSRDVLAQNVTYTYDALGRIITASYPNGATITYSYDPAGNRTQVVQVAGSPAPTGTFSASPTSITSGGSSTLYWTSANATSATINNGVGSVSPVSGGSVSVSPTTTTTYTLTLNGPGGQTTLQATVTVVQPSAPTGTFVASPTSITSGGSSALSWTSANATSASIDNGVGSVTPVSGGSVSVSPTTTTTYTLTLNGPGGQTTLQASVTVTGGDFDQTIQITGTGPVNLRTLANAAGYNGAQNATVIFQLGSGVTIMGASGGGIGIDTGTWPSGSHTISLTLQVSGKVYGGGGNGGGAGVGAGVGGDALYCRENLTVTVNSGGQIRSGGGGGGAGGSWVATPEGGGDPTYYYGGGGGGGFPNGAGGVSGGPGSNGVTGTTSNGGSGGAGAAAFGGGVRFTGAGGAGGNAGATGASGAVATGTEGCGSSICRTKTPAGVGAAAGYAIRKNGKTVSVTNNGTITGTVG